LPAAVDVGLRSLIDIGPPCADIEAVVPGIVRAGVCDEAAWKMPRKMYSVTNPMLPVTPAYDVAGAAAANANANAAIETRVFMLVEPPW
jgi:hypothetical protein